MTPDRRIAGSPDPLLPGSPDPLLPVFVNEHCVRLPSGGTAAAAVALHDPVLAGQLGSGAAYITDGRGIRIAADQAMSAGAILRVVVSSRRNRDEADADP